MKVKIVIIVLACVLLEVNIYLFISTDQQVNTTDVDDLLPTGGGTFETPGKLHIT